MTGPQAGGVIGRRGVAAVGAASILSAISSYVVLAIVARRLTPATNAEFLVFWSLLFFVIGVLGGLQQEATRASGSVELADRSDAGTHGARILPWALAAAVALSALVAGTSPLWRASVLTDRASGPAVLVLCGAGVVYTGHMTLVGVLAGRRQWFASAALVGGEALLRLVLVVAVALAGTRFFGFELAAAASTAFWLVLSVVSRTLRRAWGARADVGPRRLVGRYGHAMLAALGSAALTVGFPTLLRVSSDAREWSTAAPLVLAISLTRAPLLIPLGAFQGVAIRYFVDPRRNRVAALVRIVAVLTAIGLVGAALAMAAGPWAMAEFFGPSYRLGGLQLGALTLAAVALAVLTVTGAGVLALSLHRMYAVGWLSATAVSVGLLFLPLPLDARAILSLAAGPTVGVLVQVMAIRTVGRVVPPMVVDRV